MRIIKLALRAIVGAASLLIASGILAIVPGAEWIPLGRALVLSLGYGLVLVIVSAFLGSEFSAWRFTSLKDLWISARDTVIALIVLAVAMGLMHLPAGVIIPVVLVTLLVDTVLYGVAKLGRRASTVGVSSFLAGSTPPSSRERTPLLIVGDLAAAEHYLRSSERSDAQQYRVAGLLSSNPRDTGLVIRNTRVLGTASDILPQARSLLQSSGQPPAILFLSEDALEAQANTVGHLRALGVKLLRRSTVQEVRESVGGSLKEISVEELLYRSPIRLPAHALENYLTGQRVLVTGGGGSIGSELCRQIAANGCAHLTIVDHSEYALFKIDMEIARLFPDVPRRALLMDVRDKDGVMKLFEDEKPALVFHAAALKHVHLVEQNACQGVLTNVFGTRNVADAAASVKSKQMVLISTDKAVNPSNVMGASKRLAEAVMRAQGDKGPTYSAVRFGNVLGSAGSVVPIFSQQIARGGPVTVTDPNVERYFMTIPEAVQLVLYSSFADLDVVGSGRIYVLDMGQPVRIASLAERMIELAGKTPHKDIKIEFIGLRPGEKLTEGLVDEGEVLETAVEGAFSIRANHDQPTLDNESLQRLEAVARKGLGQETARMVFDLTRTIRNAA